VTSVALPASLSTKWELKLPGKITPPVAAQGMVFVGTDTHALFALDAQTGRERWKAILGGALLAPPSYWNGRVYAGSLDGFAYCFRAADGKAVWRYRGGPYERKLVYDGRLQSLWPLSGGVLVEDGVAYFYAGMCAHDRAFVQAVDARTGKLLWDNDTAGNAAETFGPQTGIAPHGLSPFGIPAASKEILYVPHSQYWPAAFSRADGRLLWWNKRGAGTIRPNIEVQPLGGAELSLAGELLFAGGFSALAGQSQRFCAIEARTGRPFGADDARLFERAGRDAEGKMIPEKIKRCVFGTKAISFGWGSPPLVESGKVFLNEGAVRAYPLSAYLETQFDKRVLQPLWGKIQCYEDLAAIAGGAVVLIGRAEKDGKTASPILRLVSRATGEGIRSAAGTGGERIIPSGVAIADGKCFAVTDQRKVMAFGE
jgi:outer membrane protein assembly factor BamB